MTVSFEKIPVNLRFPGAYLERDSSNATTGPGNQPFKALLIGQRLAAGSVAALTPIRITSAAQAKTYFGEGSILHRQAIAWFETNTTIELWAVAFDDPTGAKAAGDIVFTGPATAAGTLNLYIGGERVQVAISVDDTATEIAAAANAAINAKTALAVTSAVNGSDDTQIDITCKSNGTLGNELDIRINYFDGEETPAGVGSTITAMAGGSGVPDFDDLWPVLGDEHYNAMAMPYIDAATLQNVENELDDRAGPLRMIEAMVFAAKDDTLSNLGTFGNARNSEFVSVFNPAGKNSPTPAFEIGADYAAAACASLSIDPARPLQTLELTHTLPPVTTDRFTLEENNLLLFDGISVGRVDSSGNVQIARAITQYQENSFGADDIAYLNVNTHFTLSYLSWSVRTRLLLKFPRHKLAADGTRFGQGQAIVTPSVVKGELFALFSQWESAGLVENATQYINDLIVERNASDPDRLDIVMPPDLVNQLRVFAIKNQFIL